MVDDNRRTEKFTQKIKEKEISIWIQSGKTFPGPLGTNESLRNFCNSRTKNVKFKQTFQSEQCNAKRIT